MKYPVLKQFALGVWNVPARKFNENKTAELLFECKINTLCVNTEKDEIKFVVSNEEDFFWADEIINNYNLLSKTKNILFSPVSNSIEYKKLADLILKTNSNYRMQLQLHKIIWGDDVRGV